MPGIDYQTLITPYLSHAWIRLSATKQPKLSSCKEQTIRHYANPTNLMPRIEYQTLINPYLSHAWNRLSDTMYPILISCQE